MTQLTQFRDHCRRMADAEHKPECPSLPANHPYWPDWVPVHDDGGYITAMRWNGPAPPLPTCDGCLRDAGRSLFRRLADEVDAYVDEQVDLFGNVAPEPQREDA